jgi:RHS repeat-associated protein
MKRWTSKWDHVTTTYLHSGLKNAEMQTDASKAVSATKQYDAFGNLSSSTGSWQGPFGYAGGVGYQEDASGLKLLGHRYYDSSTGRFLTRDPAKDGKNWYVYCSGNPVNDADPSGLMGRWTAVMMIGAAVLTIVAPGVGIPVWGVILGGAVMGAAGAALDGASRDEIIIGGLIGGLTGPFKAAVGIAFALAMDADKLGDGTPPGGGTGGGSGDTGGGSGGTGGGNTGGGGAGGSGSGGAGAGTQVIPGFDWIIGNGGSIVVGGTGPRP